jgi:hypothetical protein
MSCGKVSAMSCCGASVRVRVVGTSSSARGTAPLPTARCTAAAGSCGGRSGGGFGDVDWSSAGPAATTEGSARDSDAGATSPAGAWLTLTASPAGAWLVPTALQLRTTRPGLVLVLTRGSLPDAGPPKRCLNSEASAIGVGVSVDSDDRGASAGCARDGSVSRCRDATRDAERGVAGRQIPSAGERGAAGERKALRDARGDFPSWPGSRCWITAAVVSEDAFGVPRSTGDASASSHGGSESQMTGAEAVSAMTSRVKRGVPATTSVGTSVQIK